MKFRPLHDRVVVRRLEGEEKTKGGIIIPETAKEKPQEGEVIAVGSGARDDNGKIVALDTPEGLKRQIGAQSGKNGSTTMEDVFLALTGKSLDDDFEVEGDAVAEEE